MSGWGRTWFRGSLNPSSSAPDTPWASSFPSVCLLVSHLKSGIVIVPTSRLSENEKIDVKDFKQSLRHTVSWEPVANPSCPSGSLRDHLSQQAPLPTSAEETLDTYHELVGVPTMWVPRPHAASCQLSCLCEWLSPSAPQFPHL